jgi:hypothetical protein
LIRKEPAGRRRYENRAVAEDVSEPDDFPLRRVWLRQALRFYLGAASLLGAGEADSAGESTSGCENVRM